VKTGLAAVEACPNGGVALLTGIDDDADGVLADTEVDATANVCNGAPAPVATTDVSGGSNCATGGVPGLLALGLLALVRRRRTA
jgi:uncharacterized protein (TIGR03382 family)